MADNNSHNTPPAVAPGAVGAERELVNPSRDHNWPPEPTTAAELEDWMTATQAALRRWLTDSRERATEISKDFDDPDTSRSKISAFTAECDADWTGWEPQIDIQTGTIFEGDRQREMKDAIAELDRRRTALHQQHATWRKHIEYTYAQACWEDFFYYQNAWNRKSLRPGVVYAESPADQQAIRKRTQLDAAKARLAKLRYDAGLPAEDEKDEEEPEIEVTTKANGQIGIRGTANAHTLKRIKPGSFKDYYFKWRDHMIRLYRHFRIGYRKRIPAVVGPSIAHRYSQPPRGTTPQELLRYRMRYNYLEERFPRKKRKVIDVAEVEETRRTNTQRRRDRELGDRNGMEPIAWRLDEVACQRLRNEKEGRHQHDPDKILLLPDDHILHHGCLETSFDWPTSFDSLDWGNNIAQTAITRNNALQESTDEEVSGAEDSTHKRKAPVRHRLDAGGIPVEKREKKPRYAVQLVPQMGETSTHDTWEDGSVMGRDVRTGEWKGTSRREVVHKERFATDYNGNRIQVDPKPILKVEYHTWVQNNAPLRPTRLQKHQVRHIVNQLSDDEDEGCVDGNANFGRSGNMNPDNVGRQKDPSEDGEGETDDDGDLFKRSYDEGSQGPRVRLARQLRTRFVTEIGELPSITTEQVAQLIRNGLSEDEIEAQYRRTFATFRVAVGS
jgi:hypothetical protein